MDLFDNENNETKNLLPCDGMVFYFGKILKTTEADYYFDQLLKNIEWTNDSLMIFGKNITTKRKVAWYGEKAFEYTYSKTTKAALVFTPELFTLKNLIEEKSGETFNSCLLNLYHSGEEGMGWHSDAEKDLKPNSSIASLSLGAERKFVLKHKTNKDKVEIILENGSLLLMGGSTQKYWLHRLPPTKKIILPRINLTFRTILENKNHF
ncbi:MAG TPA: alpha-ketoglutarate-dependent dioxygenase AlkB [Salinimicrobium sp.]|nr:alpha-ketoglutarate-dependent dioxygenase AlkB [Salinimicrobium sp.]